MLTTYVDRPDPYTGSSRSLWLMLGMFPIDRYIYIYKHTQNKDCTYLPAVCPYVRALGVTHYLAMVQKPANKLASKVGYIKRSS